MPRSKEHRPARPPAARAAVRTARGSTGRAGARSAAARTPRRRVARGVAVRRWLAVGALLLVGLLYYRPLKAYVDAHGQLAQKRATVQSLQREKQRLEHRLGSSTSLDTLAREARSLGYVRPGEHLFIVKGINQWRKRERASMMAHRGR